jgi:hypothetical protein
MTDGCIQVNGKSSWIITLSSKDEDWLQLVREYICPEMKMGQGNQVKLLSITDKKIGEWFISKGCIPRKSTILEYPDVPQQYFSDFLRGCIDGDGSISQKINKKNGKIIYSSYLCSAREEFLIPMSNILKSLGIKNSICEITKKPCLINGRMVTPKSKHYRMTFGSRATYQLVQLLYYSNHKLSMPRKMNKAIEIINHYQNLE